MAATEYNMGHAKRGLAVIINNKHFQDKRLRTRDGTDIDRDNIAARLRDLQFDVEINDDLDRKAMKDKLKEAAGRDDYHKNADCFVCVIMSHGEEESVFGTDRSIEVKQLLQPFKGHVCQSLAGKPKLFFIQACRGRTFDEGTSVTGDLGVKGDDVDDDIETYRIPTEADFLLAYSSTPGYFSWLNNARGSWFIQALCAVLEEYGATLDLLTMMTRLNNKVALVFESKSSKDLFRNKKQIPCITSMLRKDLFFRRKN